VIKDIAANGHWEIDQRETVPEDAPDDVTTVCDVSLRIDFDPDSADSSAVNLPSLVSMGWVLKKVIPLIKNEAERVVQRAVNDVEGRRRDVEFSVRVDSEYL